MIILYYLILAIFIYFILLSIGYTILLMASFSEAVFSFKEGEYGNLASLIDKHELVPITIITPTYNAKNDIMNSALAVLNSRYKNLQYVIVNDGSTDDTLLRLIKEFELYEVPPVIKQTIKTASIVACYKSKLYPNLMVVDKEHSGSSDTVNVGLNACKTPLYLTIDSDTVVEPEAISRILFTFLSNPHCICVGGAIYIKNECIVEKGVVIEKRMPSNLISAQQTCEFLRSFLYGRAGWNKFGGTLCYAGAFTMYETQAVIDSGGYEVGNFSYDVEIILKLHTHMRSNGYPYNIKYATNAFAWTEQPSTWKSYWKQRNRWQRGMLRSIFSYKRMLFNSKFGLIGFYNYPFYILYEVFGPIVEFLSFILVIVCWYIGILNTYTLFLFLILAWGYSAFLTAACIFLNAITFNTYGKIVDLFNMLSMTIIEMVGFRQYRALCCTVAFFHYIINRIRGKLQ